MRVLYLYMYLSANKSWLKNISCTCMHKNKYTFMHTHLPFLPSCRQISWSSRTTACLSISCVVGSVACPSTSCVIGSVLVASYKFITVNAVFIIHSTKICNMVKAWPVLNTCTGRFPHPQTVFGGESITKNRCFNNKIARIVQLTFYCIKKS